MPSQQLPSMGRRRGDGDETRGRQERCRAECVRVSAGESSDGRAAAWTKSEEGANGWWTLAMAGASERSEGVRERRCGGSVDGGGGARTGVSVQDASGMRVELCRRRVVGAPMMTSERVQSPFAESKRPHDWLDGCSFVSFACRTKLDRPYYCSSPTDAVVLSQHERCIPRNIVFSVFIFAPSHCRRLGTAGPRRPPRAWPTSRTREPTCAYCRCVASPRWQ